MWAVAICDTLYTADSVAAKFAAAGFVAYCPMYRKIMRGIRIEDGRKIRTRDKNIEAVVMRPVFGKYLFVQISSGIKISGTVGIRRVIADISGDLHTVPDAVIDQIKDLERIGFWDDKKTAARSGVAADDLRAYLADGGKMVRVPEWAGRIAELKAIGNDDAAWVALDAFGRSGVLAKVDASSLEIIT